MTPTLHATTVAIHGRAVLIEGPSGSGKSDLALRLIDRGAVLVADDRTAVRRAGDTLYASAPAPLAGLLEVRGLGIVQMPHLDEAPVALVVRIGAPERLPQAGEARVTEGCRVPAVTLAALEASAPIKVERALELIA